MDFPSRPSRNSKRAQKSRFCGGHRSFVRSHCCSACGQEPGDEFNPIEFAHVRLGTNCGTGLLPSDRWGVSLCANCHRLRGDAQHNRGERTFWRKLGIEDPRTLAETFARKSKHWPKLREMP